MRALLLLLLLSACAAAAPDACRLEPLADLPLLLRGTVPVLEAEINGQPAALVLDTGSDTTVLTRAAARRLGVAESASGRNVGGAGGRARAGVAVLDGFRLGPVPVRTPRLLLIDAPAPPLDGLLGIDALIDWEVELDIPAGRVRLFRARPCITARPPWTEPATQLPVQQQPGSGHLFVPVQLDGQPLRAMLDTGASRSVVSLQAAADAGLGPRALAALPVLRGQAINAEGVLLRAAQFKSLEVGGTVLPNPALAVIDLPPFAGDMLVGGDYLGTRKLWFSFLLGRVFAGPTVPAAPAH